MGLLPVLVSGSREERARATHAHDAPAKWRSSATDTIMDLICKHSWRMDNVSSSQARWRRHSLLCTHGALGMADGCAIDNTFLGERENGNNEGAASEVLASLFLRFHGVLAHLGGVLAASTVETRSVGRCECPGWCGRLRTLLYLVSVEVVGDCVAGFEPEQRVGKWSS